MALSILLMSFGLLLMAYTPVYNTISIAAGAEPRRGIRYRCYLPKRMAIRNRCGFYFSFQYVTLIGRQLIALGNRLLLQKVLLME